MSKYGIFAEVMDGNTSQDADKYGIFAEVMGSTQPAPQPEFTKPAALTGEVTKESADQWVLQEAQWLKQKFPNLSDEKLMEFAGNNFRNTHPRSWGEAASDTLTSTMKGGASFVRGMGWLIDSKDVEELGKMSEDYWAEKQSEKLVRKLQALDAKKGTDYATSLINDPAAIVNFVAESTLPSLAMMVPGGAAVTLGSKIAYNTALKSMLARGASEATAKQFATHAAEELVKSSGKFVAGTSIAGEGVQSAGSTGSDVEEFIRKAKPENLRRDPVFIDLEKRLGTQAAVDEYAKSNAAEAAVKSGLIVAAGAGIGGGLEARLVRDSLLKPTASKLDRLTGVASAAPKTIALQAGEEGVQTPGEDYAAYEQKVKIDPTQTFDPIKSVAQGAITGAPMGAGQSTAEFTRELLTPSLNKIEVTELPPVITPPPQEPKTEAKAEAAVSQVVSDVADPNASVDQTILHVEEAVDSTKSSVDIQAIIRDNLAQLEEGDTVDFEGVPLTVDRSEGFTLRTPEGESFIDTGSVLSRPGLNITKLTQGAQDGGTVGGTDVRATPLPTQSSAPQSTDVPGSVLDAGVSPVVPGVGGSTVAGGTVASGGDVGLPGNASVANQDVAATVTPSAQPITEQVVQENPVTQPVVEDQRAVVDPRFNDPEIADEFEYMVKYGIGQAERGGRVIPDAVTGDIVNKTPWIPNSDWWGARPDKTAMGESAYRGMLKRLNSGGKLTAADKRAVAFLLDTAAERIQERANDAAMGAADKEEARLEREAISAEGDIVETRIDDFLGTVVDEATAMRALGFTEEEIDAYERGTTEGDGASQATGEVPQGRAGQDQAQSGEAFNLTGETEAEVKTREAEAKKQAKDTAAKQAANDQLGDFTLTGSDRAADQAEARGQTNLFDGKENDSGASSNVQASPQRKAAIPARAISALTNALRRNNRDTKNVRITDWQGLSDASNAANGGLTKENGRLLASVVKAITGREVLFVSGINDGGLFITSTPEYLYLNASQHSGSPMATVFHEWTHSLRQTHPDIYKKLRDTVMGQDPDLAAMFRDYYSTVPGISKKTDAEIKQWLSEGNNREAMIEELVSDLVGNRALEVDFWQQVFAELNGKTTPQTFAEKLLLMLQKLKNALIGRGFEADAFVRDIDAVREAVKQALVDYKLAGTGNTQGTGAVKNSPPRGGELQSNYAIHQDTPSDQPIDGTRLRGLRRAAAGIESAEKGITFRVTEDGKAIVTGPARTKVPPRFQRFANDNGLTLVARRASGDYANANAAMPIENREAGALYFGEMGNGHGEGGAWMDRTGKTRFSPQRAPQPAFFSPLSRAIEQAPEKVFSQPAKQLNLWLVANKAKLGLKDDELQWSGILDYLNLRGKEKVSKAGVLDYLNGNGVTVQDVVKGEPSSVTFSETMKSALHGLRINAPTDEMGWVDLADKFTEMAQKRQSQGENYAADKFFTLADEATQHSEGLDNTGSAKSTPKFSGYWDSSYKGGIEGTYREILVTLPDTARDRQKALYDEMSALETPYMQRGENLPADVLAKRNALKEKIAALSKDLKQKFRSNHWDEPNVLVHLRTDEVMGADGKRYLRVGEIQSDWGQDGKKHGFTNGDLPAGWELVKSSRSDAGWQIKKDDGALWNNGFEMYGDKANALKVALSQINREKVPNSPFVTDTKAWVALGIKRAILHAIDVGADGIVFGTGQQNADLYDLSKQVDSLLYSRNEDGTYRVSAVVQGRGNMLGESIKESELEDHVGKEVAQKIVAGEGRRTEVAGEYDPVSMTSTKAYMTELTGLDLKVGGEGMRAFYDKIVPSVTNEVLKKLGGEKVGAVEIARHGQAGKTARPEDIARMKKEGSVTEQPGFLIPDAMREKVGAEGVPLFSRNRAAAKPADDELAAKFAADLGAKRDSAYAWTEVDDYHGMDDAIRALQDKHVDLKRVMEMLRQQKRNIKDAFNPYMKEELSHKRIANRQEVFVTSELDPLLLKMRANKLSIQNVEDFALALHAAERNAEMQRRNPTAEELEERIVELEEALLTIDEDIINAEDMDDTKTANQLRADKDRMMRELEALSATEYVPFEGDNTALSGMSDEVADSILAGDKVMYRGREIQFDDQTRATLRDISAKINAITAKTRALMVEYGLEKQETIDAWEATYQNYVPLQRDDVDPSAPMMPGASGYDVRGPSSRRATGSEKTPINIFANVLAMRDRVIERGEHNTVGKALYGLVLENPNPGFWTTIRPNMSASQIRAELERMGVDPAAVDDMAKHPTKRYVDKKTGLVMSRANIAFKNAGNVIATRVNGEDRFIVFNTRSERAMQMVMQMNAIGAVKTYDVIQKVAPYTRFMAAMSTQYNPFFGLFNLMRDSQTALLNLQSTQLKGKQTIVAKDAAMILGQIAKHGLRMDRLDGEWKKLFAQFEADGGTTGYKDLWVTPEDRVKDLEQKLGTTQWNRAMHKLRNNRIVNWVEHYNSAMENVFRLAAYKAALDEGMSRERAASLAKNLTVNFNRKGTRTGDLGGLYAFFNAQVQGVARIGETLVSREPGGGYKVTKTGAQIIGGGLLLGVLQAIALAAAGLGDDELKDWEKNKNLIIPIGDGQFVKIPFSLDFFIFPMIGRRLTEVALNGGEGSIDAVTDILTEVMGIAMPVGEKLDLYSITPTVLTPAASIAMNRDWLGRPVSKENSPGEHKPGWMRGKEGATVLGEGVSYAINYVSTLGNPYREGYFSPTPDDVDYFTAAVMGGLGADVLRIGKTVQSKATGDDVRIKDIPLLHRLYGNARTPDAIRSKFYELSDELQPVMTEYRAKKDSPEELEAFKEREPRWVLVDPDEDMDLGQLSRKLSDLRKDRTAALKAKNKTEMEAISKEMQELMSSFMLRAAEVAPAD